MVKTPRQNQEIPFLENGDKLTRYEFERRYNAMPTGLDDIVRVNHLGYKTTKASSCGVADCTVRYCEFKAHLLVVA